MKGLTYEERLKKLKLPTLSYRRLRGSMIEVYKIFHIYDKAATPCLPLSNLNTRGHNLKLYYSRSNKEHPKLHSFNQRVVHPWNSLPEDVVNSKNVNTFKNRLDKHWENLPLRYSYLDYQHLWTTLFILASLFNNLNSTSQVKRKQTRNWNFKHSPL